MLDIVMPVKAEMLVCLPTSLESIRETIDVPYRVICAISGRVRDDLVEAEDALAHMQEWKLLHESRPMDWNAMIHECMQNTVAKFIAIHSPALVHQGPWFGLMQRVFARDNRCMLVGTHLDLRPNMLKPGRLDRREHPTGPLALTIRKVMDSLNFTPRPGEDYIEQLSELCMRMAGNRWIEPSLRFYMQECHAADQEAG